jgi:phage portal protein BeeE
MNNPFRIQKRAANPVPHKEVDNSLCAQTADGVGLLRKLFNLSEYDAMSQSPFFAAVNIISNSIAQMRWVVKYLLLRR